jgi:hypothetical protein
MLNTENNKKLIELFLKLNPRGSVAEFARCKDELQKAIDFEIACGNQDLLEAL